MNRIHSGQITEMKLNIFLSMIYFMLVTLYAIALWNEGGFRFHFSWGNACSEEGEDCSSHTADSINNYIGTLLAMINMQQLNAHLDTRSNLITADRFYDRPFVLLLLIVPPVVLGIIFARSWSRSKAERNKKLRHPAVLIPRRRSSTTIGSWIPVKRARSLGARASRQQFHGEISKTRTINEDIGE